MRTILMLLSVLILGLATSSPNAVADDVAAGDKGVKEGTCWKDDNGNRVKVAKIRGTIHGDQKVTFESGGKSSNKATGTPASDGGCRECSPVSCDGNTYDIKGGKVRIEDSDGKMRNMRQTKDSACDDDEAESTGNNGPDTIGSLPDKDKQGFSHLVIDPPGHIVVPYTEELRPDLPVSDDVVLV